MRKLRVLLVGAAFSADLHSDAYSRILDKVEIAGICDKDLSRVRALAARYGFAGYTEYDDYAKAIEDCDCDIVDICMPGGSVSFASSKTWRTSLIVFMALASLVSLMPKPTAG